GQNSGQGDEPPARGETCQAGLSEEDYGKQDLDDVRHKLGKQRLQRKSILSIRMNDQNPGGTTLDFRRKVFHLCHLLRLTRVFAESVAGEEIKSVRLDVVFQNGSDRLFVGDLAHSGLSQPGRNMRNRRPREERDSTKDACQ